ncbi:MAG: ABC transporter ATP-binding protein [Parvularculales bacterium]
MLSLTNINQSFGALKVSDDISLEVPEGQALGIIGPNGAGKSTLFNIITGNLQPDKGRINFLGNDVTKSPPMARTVLGMAQSFQIPQPFEKLTVFENLLVAAAFGKKKGEAEVTEACALILEQTELLPRSNILTGQLSLLERKRLELARALATDPKLLLLDEIAGGLTEAECQSLIAIIRDIHAKGVTIVWIEHVLHALTSVVERLLVLDFGRVIAAGKPDKIMASKQVKEIYLGIEV